MGGRLKGATGAVMAAVLALAAAPLGAQWRPDALRDNWNATAVMGAPVLTPAGVPVGTVHDIVIGMAEVVLGVVVRTEPEAAPMLAEVRYFKADADVLAWDPSRGAMILAVSAPDVADLPKLREPPPVLPHEVRITELLGRPVHLEDAPSYATVADVLVDARTGLAEAFVILPEAGGPRRYAIPWQPDWIGLEGVRVPLTVAAVESLPPVAGVE